MRTVSAFPTDIIFALGWVLYLLLFFPGFMSTDTVHQLLEGRHGQIGDWHSPFMTLLFGAFDRIYPGPGGMLVLQTTLLWAGLWLFYRSCIVKDSPNLGATLLFALMFYPAVLGVNGVIWKDILMAGGLMMMIGAIACICDGQFSRFAMISLAFAAAFLALLARINAIFFIFPLMVVLILSWSRLKGKSGLATSVLTGAVVSIALALLAMSVNKWIADRPLHAVLSIALFDVSGTIANLPPGERLDLLFQSLPEILTSDRAPDDVARSYSSRDWQAVFRGDSPGLNSVGQFQTTHVAGFTALTKQQRDSIMQSWRRAIVQEPRAYIVHRFAVLDWLLAFRKFQWQPVLLDPANYPEALQEVLPPFSTQTTLQHTLEQVFTKMSYYPPYKPWFCLAISLVLLTWLLANPSGRSLEVALLVSVPSHLFGLFFLAPTPDFRYMHVIFLATGVAITRVICKTLKS